MRRCIPVGLILLLAACKSPEEKACENTVRITQAALEQYGRSDGKSDREHQRNCLESLSRLRQEIQPDEDTWYTYLRCLRDSQDMTEQFDCLAPLTAEQFEKLEAQTKAQTQGQVDSRK